MSSSSMCWIKCLDAEKYKIVNIIQSVYIITKIYGIFLLFVIYSNLLYFNFNGISLLVLKYGRDGRRKLILIFFLVDGQTKRVRDVRDFEAVF